MHRLLRRQLLKAFPDGVPDGLEGFLDLVDEAYEASDDDRGLLERAMELTSKELVQRNDELASRVRDLERAQEKLRASDAWRRQFLNQAAHELGTPLTPIRMQVHVLKRGMQENHDRSVALLERNVDRLATLVRDLLDSAKLQSDHLAMHITDVDMVAAVHASVSSLEPVAEAAGVQIRVEAPEFAAVSADAARIDQTLDNLLGNALKFSPQGSEVTIRVQDGPMVQVEVIDQGMGLEADDLERIFEPFVQAHADMRDAPAGTGLGLYICRGIVDACKGQLTAASPGPGQGATFTLRLPAAGA